MTAKIPMPDPIVAAYAQLLAGAPSTLLPVLVGQMAEGAEAARKGLPSKLDEDDEVPPSEVVERARAEIRRAALRAAVPAGRVEAVRRGLASLDPADQHPAQLRAWLADPDQQTLILAGTTGSGKTQAAYATAVETVATGAVMRDRAGKASVRLLLVRAWTTNGYFSELRPEGSPEPSWQIRDKARTAELLILDDLGAELDGAATQHARTELVELLGYRLDRNLRTIVTTNLRSAALQERVGTPVMSRLAERSTVLQFLGPDRRNLSRLDW